MNDQLKLLLKQLNESYKRLGDYSDDDVSSINDEVRGLIDAVMTIATLLQRIELCDHSHYNPSLDEALNSSDGVYRP